jgi:hypothetical protein
MVISYYSFLSGVGIIKLSSPKKIHTIRDTDALASMIVVLLEK